MIHFAGRLTDSHSPPTVNGAAGGGADGHLILPGASGSLGARCSASHYQGETLMPG